MCYMSRFTHCVPLMMISLKSLAFQHPTENDVLDHPKDVFHQIRVRRCRRKIVNVSVWVFVLLQILPLYILPANGDIHDNLRDSFWTEWWESLTMRAQSHLVLRSLAGSPPVCGSSASLWRDRPCWRRQWRGFSGRRLSWGSRRRASGSPSFCWWCRPRRASGWSRSRRWWRGLQRKVGSISTLKDPADPLHWIMWWFDLDLKMETTCSDIVKALDPLLPLTALPSHIHQLKLQLGRLMNDKVMPADMLQLHIWQLPKMEAWWFFSLIYHHLKGHNNNASGKAACPGENAICQYLLSS